MVGLVADVSSNGITVEDLRSQIEDATGINDQIENINNALGDTLTFSDVASIDNRVEALEGEVGNMSSGLVKDVGDLKDTVGNSSSGLVFDLDAAENDIGAL